MTTRGYRLFLSTQAAVRPDYTIVADFDPNGGPFVSDR